jgi:hypothetical protein
MCCGRGWKAAFFDYFLCSSKESNPPAGEAATEKEARKQKRFARRRGRRGRRENLKARSAA